MTSPNLLGMPENVLFQILSYSSFRSIQILRKVCKPLRSFIDETEPSANLKYVEISYFDKKCIFNCENSEKKGIELEYFPKENGCFVNHIFKNSFLKNQNFSDIFLQDVHLILKFQKSILAKLEINWDSCNSRILENLEGSFKTRIFEVQFRRNMLEMSKILEIVDPKVLKSLKIRNQDSGSYSNLGNINSFLDKFENLEKLEFEDFKVSIDFRKIRNLKFAKIFVESLTLKDLEIFKEIFPNSRTPKKFSIRIEKLANIVDQISQIFGQPIISFGRQTFRDYSCKVCKPHYNATCQGITKKDVNSCATAKQAKVQYYLGMPPNAGKDRNFIPEGSCTMNLKCPAGSKMLIPVYEIGQNPVGWCAESGSNAGVWYGGNFRMPIGMGRGADACRHSDFTLD
ncbi:hypothetical protein B9Z55_021462 [Caenorhabditis nigoni]|uniref:F-box domain-containing protein n=1 Tax=Caenorhabditis nigoni TaxID=1611254 RepID=A0A2G5TSZ9_9PELO|nr:hypothetical protein B9Z55_021462 [Caenorhabditis nigoni]